MRGEKEQGRPSSRVMAAEEKLLEAPDKVAVQLAEDTPGRAASWSARVRGRLFRSSAVKELAW